MKVYIYNKDTFEFIYEEEANLDPLETKIQGREIFAIPAYATTIAPNLFIENTTNVFDEEKQKWNIVKDYRGTIVYNKKTGEELFITELGEIPGGYVLEKPFNIQIARIEAIRKINALYAGAHSAEIKLGKISANVDKRNDLLFALNGLDDEHNECYINTNEEAILLTKEELKEATEKLYERSMQLPALKNEYIKKIKACRSQNSLNKIIAEAEKELV